MILAGDVGGTKIHLALFEAGQGAPEMTVETMRATADVSDPVALMRDFTQETGVVPEAVALGVAGPVIAGRIDGTNLPWSLDETAIARAFRGADVHLMNDVIASAHGLDDLPADALRTIQAGAESPGANRAIVSPGTGLGECLLVGRGKALVAVGTEGGHADFAPTTEEQIELWRTLHRRFGRVSVEHVVSGPGIAHVYEWLRGSGRFAGESESLLSPDDTEGPARISEAALKGTSPLCRETLRVWIAAFGAEAGNAALRAVALGGVFLGGGIPPRIEPLLLEAGFLEAFGAKDPFRELLGKIPVHVVREPETCLRGAARYAADRLAGITKIRDP
jgi:glucokinase